MFPRRAAQRCGRGRGGARARAGNGRTTTLTEALRAACTRRAAPAGGFRDFVGNSKKKDLKSEISHAAAVRDICTGGAIRALRAVKARPIASINQGDRILAPAHIAPSPGTPGEGRCEGSSADARHSQSPKNPHPIPLPSEWERGRENAIALPGSTARARLHALRPAPALVPRPRKLAVLRRRGSSAGRTMASRPRSVPLRRKWCRK